MPDTCTTLRYDPSACYEVRWQEVPYLVDGDQRWLARVYQPQGDGPFPALLELHGGAWTLMDRTQNQDTDEVLAASGMVVVAVGSSRVDLQACKLEYSIVSPK